MEREMGSKRMLEKKRKRIQRHIEIEYKQIKRERDRQREKIHNRKIDLKEIERKKVRGENKDYMWKEG